MDRKFQQPTFEAATAEDVLAFTRDFKERGYSFVNICATTVADGCELLYAFQEPDPSAIGLTGRNVFVPTGARVDSITSVYPEAFVFENESHDLFGIEFAGLSIDYGGEFYTVSVAYPMNPAAAAPGQQPAAGEEGSDE